MTDWIDPPGTPRPVVSTRLANVWDALQLGTIENRAGAPVLIGSLVQTRPAIVYAVRWFPSILTRLMMARSIVLAAVSMPALTIAFTVGFILRASEVGSAAWMAWTALTWITVNGWLLTTAWFGATGPAWGVSGLIAIVFTWKLALAKWFPAFDLDPWLFLFGTALVAAPVLASPVGAVVVAVGVTELLLGARLPSVRVWRLAWQIRRRWPMLWAIVASTTSKPQASFGGGTGRLFGETRKDSPRELLGHPPLGLIPDFSVPGSVAWRVFRPNGQLVNVIAELAQTINEALPKVRAVTVTQPEGEGCSWGVIRFWFTSKVDPLEGTVTADPLAGFDPDDAADLAARFEAAITATNPDTDVDTEAVVLGDIGPEPQRVVLGAPRVVDPTTGEILA